MEKHDIRSACTLRLIIKLLCRTYLHSWVRLFIQLLPAVLFVFLTARAGTVTVNFITDEIAGLAQVTLDGLNRIYA
jgi:hypothetical protein